MNGEDHSLGPIVCRTSVGVVTGERRISTRGPKRPARLSETLPAPHNKLPLFRARDATRNQPWICGRFTAKPLAAEGNQAGPENVRLATRSSRTRLALNETTLCGPMVMAVPVFRVAYQVSGFPSLSSRDKS